MYVKWNYYFLSIYFLAYEFAVCFKGYFILTDVKYGIFALEQSVW